ncbi:MAG: pyridoxamine 5'-phosphate oxidase [Cyclobacteriaceae bacterium]
MEIKIADLRKDYKKSELTKSSVNNNPFEQFKNWLQEAIDAALDEPTAMIIGTVSLEGRPATRTVLLKGLEDGKFIFFSNYNSRKGQHLAANPFISITFFWPGLERQVHIEGSVEKLSPALSDAYFLSRPYTSRIGARVSPQSQKVQSRNDIKLAFVAESAKFVGREVPRPEHWGGYAVTPERMEFWQGRESRLHDRILYLPLEGDKWEISRLAP